MNDVITYYRATEKDMPDMINSRIDFLADVEGPQREDDIAALRTSLEAFLPAALKDNTYICWLASAGGRTIGTGGLAVRRHPGNFKNPSGRMGYVMNMYTRPEYRRKGVCSTILNKLVDTGVELGLTTFELHASELGQFVYHQHGFVIHNEPTYRKFIIKP